MPTPLGRIRFWRELTVLGVGFLMSINLLWVFMTNLSFAALCLKVERLTVSIFFSVGKGVGPEIIAPERLAVSRIVLVASSIMRW